MNLIEILLSRLGNLGKQFQSLDSMTQLVILIRKFLVNKYGIEKIINPLKEDLLKLESDGIEISLNKQKFCKFRARPTK
jgi:hypothetical protein